MSIQPLQDEDTLTEFVLFNDWKNSFLVFQNKIDSLSINDFLSVCQARVRVENKEQQNWVWEFKKVVFEDLLVHFKSLNAHEDVKKIENLLDLEYKAVNEFYNYIGQDIKYLSSEQLAAKYIFTGIVPEQTDIDSFLNTFLKSEESEQIFLNSISGALSFEIERKINETMGEIGSANEIVDKYEASLKLDFLRTFLIKWKPTGLFTLTDLAKIELQIKTLSGIFEISDKTANTKIELSERTKILLRNVIKSEEIKIQVQTLTDSLKSRDTVPLTELMESYPKRQPSKEEVMLALEIAQEAGLINGSTPLPDRMLILSKVFNTLDEDSTPVQSIIAQDDSKDMFISMSPRRLIFFSVMTLFIYNIYWFYKNWRALKKIYPGTLNPILGCIFAPILAIGLFRKILSKAELNGYSSKYSADELAFTFFVSVLMLNVIPNDIGIIFYPIMLVMLFIQAYILSFIQRAINYLPKEQINTNDDSLKAFVIIFWLVVFSSLFLAYFT